MPTTNALPGLSLLITFIASFAQSWIQILPFHLCFLFCSIILAHAACQVGCLGLQHLKFEEQGQQSWRTQRLRIQNFQKSLMRFQIPDAENATHHKKRCRRCCKRKRKTTLYNNNSQPCKQHKIDGGVNHDDNDYTTSSNFGWWIH